MDLTGFSEKVMMVETKILPIIECMPKHKGFNIRVCNYIDCVDDCIEYSFTDYWHGEETNLCDHRIKFDDFASKSVEELVEEVKEYAKAVLLADEKKKLDEILKKEKEQQREKEQRLVLYNSLKSEFEPGEMK